MKYILTLSIILLALSCSEKKAETAKKEMTDEERLMQPKKVNTVNMNDAILDQYFKIQEQLVNDTDKDVKQFVQDLKKAVDASSYEQKEKLMIAVNAMEAAPNMKEIRTTFYPLSTLMIDYVKSASLTNDVYLMHCTMAFNNTGADWLQNSKKLYNPYFGSRMLTCGSTKETIAKSE